MMASRLLVSTCALLTASLLAAPAARAQADKIEFPPGEAHFSPAERREYYQVYQNGDVRYLRTAFNAFLAGKEKDAGVARVLRPWDPAYLKSRFSVMSREETPFGITVILLVAQDRPDRLIRAAVYHRSRTSFILRGLEDVGLSKEAISSMRARYRQFLTDSIHAM